MSMQTKTDQSYGVIPVYKKGEDYEVLVVNQISYRGDQFWVFPKGHPNEGELGEAAALRELREETGLTEAKLDTEHPLEIHYQFNDKNTLIKKTVTYFIGHCVNQKTKIIQPREIAELRWCSPEEAIQLLTHENSRQLLKKTLKALLGANHSLNV